MSKGWDSESTLWIVLGVIVLALILSAAFSDAVKFRCTCNDCGVAVNDDLPTPAESPRK